MITMTILLVLSASTAVPIGESTCAEWDSCFDGRKTALLDASIEAEVREVSEKYLAVLMTNNVDSAEIFWSELGGRHHPDSNRSRLLSAALGLNNGHISTTYRKSYAVTEAMGKDGYYVVFEYGTRSNSGDVLHSVVWTRDEDGWKIVCHAYIFACPPNSAPVKLAPVVGVN